MASLYPLHHELLANALRTAALASTDPAVEGDYIALTDQLADLFRSDDIRVVCDELVQRSHPAVKALLAGNPHDADADELALTQRWQSKLIPFLVKLDSSLRYQLVTQEDDTSLSNALLDRVVTPPQELPLVDAPDEEGLRLTAYTWDVNAIQFETNDGYMGPFQSWIVPIDYALPAV